MARSPQFRTGLAGDPVTERSWVEQDGSSTTLLRERTQDDSPILDFAKAARQERAVQERDWGRWELSIPEIHWERLVKRYPDLASPNGETAKRAWVVFLNSAESAPFRVRERGRANARSVGGI